MLNLAVLMGRLTADPELRHTNSGTPVTSFTLAVDRAYTKDSERITDFLNIVAWRHTAEFVCKYFRKGQLVAVEGTIQMRDYVDRENTKRRVFEIVASNVHFAEPRRDNNTGGQPRFSDQDAPPLRGAVDDVQTAPSFTAGDVGGFSELSDHDDDLPF